MRQSEAMTAIAKQAGAEPAGPRVPPSETRSLILLGFVIIALAFGGMGGWAALAPLDSAAIAPGVLVVEGQRKVVAHLEGGIVHEIFVQEGSSVEAGDVLIRLDDTQAGANVDLLRKQRDFALVRQARLIAEKEGWAALRFPDELIARQDSAEIAELLASEQRLFEERQRSKAGQIDILRERIVQLKEQIRGISAERTARQTQVAIMKDELVGLRELHEKGYYPRTRVLEMERQLAALTGEVGSASANIAKAETGIGEAELQIVQVEQEFREHAVTELRDVEKQLSDLTERLVVARDILQRIDIVAPQSGFVQKLSVHTIGGVVRGGEPLLEVVPVEKELLIEAQISPLDIATIAPGQETEVRFSALKSRSTPVIFGRVETVSADRIVNERANTIYYLARIVVNEEERKKLADHKLQAGMPADVIIKTGERTFMEYLIKPIEDSLARSLNEY